MRYLKLFEGVEGIDNLYKEVSEGEYDELSTSHVKFTTYEELGTEDYYKEITFNQCYKDRKNYLNIQSPPLISSNLEISYLYT